MIYSTRRFVLYLALLFCSYVFSPFSIAIPSLGVERASRCLSYVCLICTYLVVSVSSSTWCLRRAAVCDCGTPWTFLLPPFFINTANMLIISRVTYPLLSTSLVSFICYRFL